MKSLSIAVLLLTTLNLMTSCVSTATVKNEKRLEGAVERLSGDIKRLDYFIEHDKCFITYSICLGEKKKVEKLCWNEHEQCVIDVYRKWKSVE